jgi:hypothetical protein
MYLSMKGSRVGWVSVTIGAIAAVHVPVAAIAHPEDPICPRPGVLVPELPACGSGDDGPSLPPRTVFVLGVASGGSTGTMTTGQYTFINPMDDQDIDTAPAVDEGRPALITRST